MNKDKDLERVRSYYDATTTTGYLRSWGGASGALHLGLDADGTSEGHERSLVNTNAELARRAGIGEGSRVLDAGCGVGSFSLWAAATLGVRAVGLNITASQLALARARSATAGLRVDWVLGDYRALPLAGGGFDAVVMLESLCHARDPRACVGEARRVLRPGGRFACLDVFRGSGGPHFEDMVRGTVLGRVCSREEMRATLVEAGFADVEDESLSERVRISARHMGQLALRRMTMLRFERLLLGTRDELYEAHTIGALGAARGLESGDVTYGYVGGRAP